MKSLVVDDDFISRTKMQAILECFGECLTADSGKTALSMFNDAHETTPFDLICLDINMPDMDGTEVLFNLREQETNKNIQKQDRVKIVMVSSHSDKDYIITCLQAGCNDYIVKPFDEKSIIEKLGNLGIKKEAIKPPQTKLVTTKGNAQNSGEDDTDPGKSKKDKIKTLVVDDDFISRTKMQVIMEDFGECVAVENGHAAIAMLNKALEKNEPFDLVTLDIAMPDMDGTEVLFRIRECETRKNILKGDQVKIIMVTAHSDKGHIITCVQAGCNDYIIKPFDVKSITKKLNEIHTKEGFAFYNKKNFLKNGQI